MKHDHSGFSKALRNAPARHGAARDPGAAYGDRVEDRVRRFLPMVRSLAWHLHGSGRSQFDLDDLMQAGLVALTECAQRHEGPVEDGFAAYAKMRVRGAMVDLIRRNCAGSRGAAERRRRIEAASVQLRGELGREPHADEVAAHLGLSMPEFESLRDAAQAISFEPLDDSYNDSDARFADDGPDGLQMLLDSELREALIAQIAALPERLQLVIQLYFLEELGLAEIAEVMSVSVPRVHQLKARALELLREGLEDLADIR